MVLMSLPTLLYPGTHLILGEQLSESIRRQHTYVDLNSESDFGLSKLYLQSYSDKSCLSTKSKMTTTPKFDATKRVQKDCVKYSFV